MSAPKNNPQWTRRAVLRSGMATVVAAGVATDARPESPENATGITLQPFEKVEPQKFPWGSISWLMSAAVDPKAEMTIGLVEINAHQSNPVHMHPNSAEFLHVLAGSCEHRVGRRWIKLKTGDTLRIPKGIVHTARTGDEPCRAMVMYDTGTRQMVPVTEDAASGKP